MWRPEHNHAAVGQARTPPARIPRLARRAATCDFAHMRHVTIQLSEAQEALLHQRLAHSAYDTVDDLLAALVEAELRVDAQDRLEALLLEGLKSERLPWTPERMEQIRRNAGLTA